MMPRPKLLVVKLLGCLLFLALIGTTVVPSVHADGMPVGSVSDLEPIELGYDGQLNDPVPDGVEPLTFSSLPTGREGINLDGAPAASGGELGLEASLAMYRCDGYGVLPRYNPVDRVAQDFYAFDIFAPVKVGDGNGNVNWGLDPYRDLGWKLWFSSLRWLGTSIEAARGGDRVAFDKATTVIKDWSRDHGTDWSGNSDHMEANSHRLNVLICYREVVMGLHGGKIPADFAWLGPLMEQHARHNIGRWSGINNHGSMENRVLLAYGCLTGNISHQTTAMRRITQAFPSQIDAEGLSNEAAPHYAAFNYLLFRSIADVMGRCGYSASSFTQRVDRLGTSLAHMTDSTGHFWEYGNSNIYRQNTTAHPAAAYASTNGKQGTAPSERIKAYEAGPVFGRSTWGNPSSGFGNSSAWMLRTGTGTEHKAHRGDVMSFLYTARGRKVVVDGGFAGVTSGKWGTWDRSEVAHNVIHIPAIPSGSFGPAKVTRTQWGRDGRADFTEATQSYSNVATKTRGVLVMTDPDVTVVLDRTRINDGRPRAVQTLWNLPTDQTTTISGRSVAVASFDGGSTTKVVLQQVPFWGNPAPQRGEIFRYRGADGTSPRGFYFPRTFTPTATDQVGFSRVGTAVGTISVIVPTRKAAKVSVVRGRFADGATKLTITIGSDVVEVRITGGGYLSRTR